MIAEKRYNLINKNLINNSYRLKLSKGVLVLYVEDEFRGKGIGKALFLETEKLVKEKGAKRLDLHVWEFNSEAVHFYKALGMQIQRYTLEKDL